MYAVIRTGGKQYKVKAGDLLKVELLPVEVGAEISFDEVLFLADGENIKIGAPLVPGGKVTAQVTCHGRGEKIKIVKMRRRKHYRKQMGHRQHYTEVKVGLIEG